MHAIDQQQARARPVDNDERVTAIDITRGAALFGVLLMNLETGFRMPLALTASALHTESGRLNHAVDWLLVIAVSGKAFAAFSLLFGVGLGLQLERARAAGRGKTLLVRRLALLFVLGVAHLLLLWNGDILALYAAAGVVALIFASRPTRSITVAITVIAIISSLPYGGRSPVTAGGNVAAVEQALQTYGGGSYADIVHYRLHETARQMLPLYMIQLPRTVGLFLLGILAYRRDVFQRPEEHRPLLRTVLGTGAALGICGTALRALDAASVLTLGPMRNPVLALSNVPLSLAYMAALLLFLAHEPARHRLAWLAPVGRMALSNYLVQSLVLGFVFYGYGLGLFGRLSSAEALPIGLLLYAAQIFGSALWLRRFEFGPAEWLWRSATYGTWPTMSRARRPS